MTVRDRRGLQEDIIVRQAGGRFELANRVGVVGITHGSFGYVVPVSEVHFGLPGTEEADEGDLFVAIYKCEDDPSQVGATWPDPWIEHAHSSNASHLVEVASRRAEQGQREFDIPVASQNRALTTLCLVRGGSRRVLQAGDKIQSGGGLFSSPDVGFVDFGGVVIVGTVASGTSPGGWDFSSSPDVVVMATSDAYAGFYSGVVGPSVKTFVHSGSTTHWMVAVRVGIT